MALSASKGPTKVVSQHPCLCLGFLASGGFLVWTFLFSSFAFFVYFGSWHLCAPLSFGFCLGLPSVL